jgi:putative hydrolase of the HAD superfamily
MIKAVLFDLDGTLLDRDASLALFIEGQYERLRPHLGHVPKGQYTERFIELDARGYCWKDRVYQQLLREFAIESISWEILLDDYVSRFQDHCVPFPGLEEMLAELKKRSFRLGIITNGPGGLQLDSIRSLGVGSYFDVVLVSGIEGVSKPDPRIFNKALGALGVRPQEAVYVGDHPANDIEAAKAVGMVSVWKRDPQYDAASADYVIEDLDELPKILERFQVRIEPFKPEDTEELVELFYGTVHSVNASDYSSDQLAVWAPEGRQAEKAEQWRTSLSRNAAFVAKKGGKIVGFCDLEAGGRLDRLYVHRDYQRQGIASRLMDHAERKAVMQGQSEIRTEASITAKPFFLLRGYDVIQEQTVERQGIRLQNFLMAKRLDECEL